MQIGNTTTLPPGSDATASTNKDEELNILYLNLGIPEGLKGDKGDTGDTNLTSFDIIDGKLIAYNEDSEPIVMGTVAIAPKGEYNSSTYYEKLNIVEYEGSSYMAKQPVHNVLPTDEQYWQYLGGGVKITDTIIVFDTVANMKASEILKDGMTVQTLGYYSVNDCGGATYNITDEESNSDYQEELESGLYATLIVNDVVNVKQLGAYGDNIHDDTNVLNYAFSNYQWKVIYLPAGNYKTTNTINIVEGKTVFGDGMFLSTIKYYGSTKAVEISNLYYGILTIKELSIIKNGNYVEGDTTSIGINISKGANDRVVSNLYMEKVVIRYFGINFNCSIAGALLNAHFKNCNFENGYENCHIVGGFNNYFLDCRFGEAVQNGYFQQSGEGKFVNCSFEGNKRAVRITNSNGSYSFINCFFENTDTTEATNASFISIAESSLALIENILIIGCHFYGGYRQIYLSKVKRVTLINNEMNNPGLACVAHSYTDTNIKSITYINNNFAVEPYNLSTFVHFVDENETDTGWIDINTSNASRGTFHNFQIRKIGKIVKLKGFVDNLTDTDKGQTFGVSIPEGYRPSHNINYSCAMSQGNLGDFTKQAAITFSSSGWIKLQDYNATSNVQNQISFDEVIYFV